MQERRFTVYGRELAALTQGEAGQPPVLALHGWLDNAASFLPLAEHLQGFHLLALDLAGHGHSAHRAADGEYNIWSDLPDILAVAELMGWDQFNLVGHSRGALIATLFASAMPEKVRCLSLLDAASPRAAEPEQCPAQLAAYLRDKQRLLDKQSRVFESEEAAIALRAGPSLTRDAAALIVRRNLRPVEGGWKWSTDARLQGASAFKLTQAHSDAVMAALTMPTLLLLAQQGFGGEYRPIIDDSSIRTERLAGGHHCHMEDSAATVAGHLREFILGEALS